MRTLALDLATTTGWAEMIHGDPPRIRWGHRRISPAGCSVGVLMHDAEVYFHSLMFDDTVLVAFESPLPPQGQMRTDIARKLIGLAVMVEKVTHERGIPVKEAGASTVRKFFCGISKKELVVPECFERGFQTANKDEADAIALLHFAAFNEHDIVIPSNSSSTSA